MKNKIFYGILIFFLIISDFVYIDAFISGGFIPNDISGNLSVLFTPLLFLLSLISLIIGLTKINKHKLTALILMILSLPTLISAVWMYTHKNDFSPHMNNAIKANLTNTRFYIEKKYELSNSYLNICEEADVIKLINEIEKIEVETKCFSDSDSYVLSAELKRKPKNDDRYYDNNYFCVDSEGTVESITTSQNQSITNANTLCTQE